MVGRLRKQDNEVDSGGTCSTSMAVKSWLRRQAHCPKRIAPAGAGGPNGREELLESKPYKRKGKGMSRVVAKGEPGA